jgi:hypothetical protein
MGRNILVRFKFREEELMARLIGRHAERSRSISTAAVNPVDLIALRGRDASASLSMTFWLLLMQLP